MTYIWNRVDRVPTEDTANISDGFNEWLRNKKAELKTQDLKKKQSVKNSIRTQTASYEDAMRKINS